MRHTSFRDMHCHIARGLERVGEWWSFLILRDAIDGSTRFDQFQRSLPIAPSMLTRRLGDLVKAGLLERRRYSTRPPRYEYVLTESGRDLYPVIVALDSWGRGCFPTGKDTLRLVDRSTGKRAEPVLVDRRSGKAITAEEFRFVPGPEASEKLKERLAYESTRTEVRRQA